MKAKPQGFITANLIILVTVILLTLGAILEETVLQQKTQQFIFENENFQQQQKAIIKHLHKNFSTTTVPINCQLPWSGSDLKVQQKLLELQNSKACQVIINGHTINYLIITANANNWWIEAA